MESKSGKEDGTNKAGGKRPGRGWTERFSGPIVYRRFTDYDGGGRPSIIFKFELAPGQSEMPRDVYEVLHQLKHLDRSPGHGRKPHFTGLEYTRDTRHGRVWRLPDTPAGRTAADIIDAKLCDLAHKIEQATGQGR